MRSFFKDMKGYLRRLQDKNRNNQVHHNARTSTGISQQPLHQDITDEHIYQAIRARCQFCTVCTKGVNAGACSLRNPTPAPVPISFP